MEKPKADFNALNDLRLQTLRRLREMISEEAAVWARYRNESAAPEIISHVASKQSRFRELWDQHEAVRKDMADAGFLPPPVPVSELPPIPLDDPIRLGIEEKLKAELESARSEYNTVSQEFRLFVRHGTGLPAPDGNLRARQIAMMHSAALRRYTAAIRRFNAFLADGGGGDVW